ncbi:MAG: type II secretion system protein [Candidatus Omnitrophica bacterium]|nr:type II secretion system protein [Candidatus Omnitrophota bacterium]
MPREKKQAWTLVELLIVVVIIGILASLVLPNYKRMKEGTYDKEALADLKLMVAAAKIYRLEQGTYINATNTTVVNDLLRLTLPTSAQANWDHEIVNATYVTFTAKAGRRPAPYVRIWRINETKEEPYQDSAPW